MRLRTAHETKKATEKGREARKLGYLTTEQPLADGSIRVTIQMQGAS